MNCRTISLPNGLLLSVIAIATFLKIYKYERVNGNLVMLLPLGCPLLIVVSELSLCHSGFLPCSFKVSWCWENINKSPAFLFPLAPPRTHRTEDQLLGPQWSGGHGKVIWIWLSVHIGSLCNSFSIWVPLILLPRQRLVLYLGKLGVPRWPSG